MLADGRYRATLDTGTDADRSWPRRRRRNVADVWRLFVFSPAVLNTGRKTPALKLVLWIILAHDLPLLTVEPPVTSKAGSSS